MLFLWGHMFFVSSILLGKDAMWTVTRFFEGYYVFGTPRVERARVAPVPAALFAVDLMTLRWCCSPHLPAELRVWGATKLAERYGWL